jgi:hypothetical protein
MLCLLIVVCLPSRLLLPHALFSFSYNSGLVVRRNGLGSLDKPLSGRSAAVDRHDIHPYLLGGLSINKANQVWHWIRSTSRWPKGLYADRRRGLSQPQGTGCEGRHHAGDLSRRRCAIRGVHLSWQTGDGEYRSRLPVHPATQEAMAVKSWRNAQRVSSDPSARAYGRRAEALAKGDMFRRVWPKIQRDHGCKAVGLHRAGVRASGQRSGVSAQHEVDSRLVFFAMKPL